MKIREIRDQAGVTQQEMAQEIGVCLRTIANWEDRQFGQLKAIQREAVKRFARRHKVKLDKN